uniref:RING-type domain-containing protein n=1 Tax=Plectus sambesii TaxID=2011161 RepID=A0A914VIR5_9BILA
MNADQARALLAFLFTRVQRNLANLLRSAFPDGPDEEYVKWMKDLRVDLAKRAPQNVLQLFYADQEPIPIADLYLRSLFILFVHQPKLTKLLSVDELKSLEVLDKYLILLYSVINDVPVDESKDDVMRALRRMGLGLTDSDFDSLDSKENNADDDSCADILISQLNEDSDFQDKFLKSFKALKVKTNEEMPKIQSIDEKLRKIETQGKIDLDNFTNIRQALLRKLPTLLNCSICQQRMTEPRTLPCMHSACVTCLKKVANLTEKTITCASCQRRIAAATQHAIETLPCSFAITSLSALLTNLEENTISECPHCIRPAKAFNLRGGETMCDSHAMPIYYKQPPPIILAATELLDMNKLNEQLQRYCPQHYNVLEKFCSYCQVPCCAHSSCLAWHSSHGRLNTIVDVNKEQKEQLQKLAEKLSEKESRADTVLKQTEQNQVSVADLQENIRESMKQYFGDIRARLDAKELEFNDELDNVAQLCWHQDEVIRQSLKEHKDKIGAFKEKIDALLQSEKSESPLTNLGAMRQELLEILADSANGALLSEGRTLMYPEANLRSLLQSTVNLKSAIIASTNGRGWEVVAKVDGLRHFVVYGTKLYALRRTKLGLGCQVLTYDLKNLSGTEPTVFFENSARDFQSVAAAADGQLMIAHEVQSNLELPKIRLRYSVTVGLYPQARTPVASTFVVDCLNSFSRVRIKVVTVDSTAHFFIGDDQSVAHINPADGHLLRKFDFQSLALIGDFAPDPDRHLLVVTDIEKNLLLIYNSNQQKTLTFGSTADSVGLFHRPTGVSLDCFGTIFVADTGNNRVQVLDLEGKALKTVPFPDDLNALPGAVTAFSAIQACGTHIYLFDTRSDTIYRRKYAP